MELNRFRSAAELAKLGAQGVPGLVTSARGIAIKAERDGWEFKTVPGKGGKGGLKRLFKVPDTIFSGIRRFELEAKRGKSPYQVEQPQAPYSVGPKQAVDSPSVAPSHALINAEALAAIIYALIRSQSGNPNADVIAKVAAETYERYAAAGIITPTGLNRTDHAA